MLELSFLGSGNAFNTGGRYCSSFLLNGRYLFEAPPSVLPHLKRLGVPPADVKAVFVTHFHGDHFLGFPFLLLEYLYRSPRQDDLYVIGPPGIQRMVEELTDLAFSHLRDADAGYNRRYLEVEPGGEAAIADVRLRALPMKHAGDHLHSFGYRLAVREGVVAYTGDTGLCDEVFALAEGADVLVMDCHCSESPDPHHMDLSDALQVRKRLPPSTTIILTHLETEPDVRGVEGMLVAQDFATFRFP